MQSVENHRKECHQFWLCLRYAMILILNVRTSASKKTNWMALISTLMVLTTVTENMKENFYGFRLTVFTSKLMTANLFATRNLVTFEVEIHKFASSTSGKTLVFNLKFQCLEIPKSAGMQASQ